jgi:NNP family nitrate/nitrite transporter-like MFS transporter
VAAFAWALLLTTIMSDDRPETTLILRKHGAMPEVSAAASFRPVPLTLNILVLSSVRLLLEELTMNNAAALY